MTTKPLTLNQTILRDAIVAHYIETGRYCTTAEIATKLAWSKSKVRELLGRQRDDAPLAGLGTAVRRVAGVTRSHIVTVYGPTLAHLRSLLIQAMLSATSA